MATQTTVAVRVTPQQHDRLIKYTSQNNTTISSTMRGAIDALPVREPAKRGRPPGSKNRVPRSN